MCVVYVLVSIVCVVCFVYGGVSVTCASFMCVCNMCSNSLCSGCVMLCVSWWLSGKQRLASDPEGPGFDSFFFIMGSLGSSEFWCC